MPDTDVSFAEIVAERLREEVEASEFVVNAGRDALKVTVSIGISSTDDGPDSDTAQKLIKRADEALYNAKTGGRNRVVKSAA